MVNVNEILNQNCYFGIKIGDQFKASFIKLGNSFTIEKLFDEKSESLINDYLQLFFYDSKFTSGCIYFEYKREFCCLDNFVLSSKTTLDKFIEIINLKNIYYHSIHLYPDLGHGQININFDSRAIAIFVNEKSSGYLLSQINWGEVSQKIF